MNKVPLLPVITIEKNDASTYTYNPFTSVFDFRVGSFRVKPPFDARGGNFELKIYSDALTNAATNTLLTNIRENNQVTIWIGKTNATKTKVFLGIIESIEIIEPNKNLMEIVLTGPDWGSDILKNRRVNDSWIQRKDLTDPNKVDQTDTSTTQQQIAIDLLTRDKTYPDRSFPIPVDDYGVVVSSANITGDDLQISQFEANMETIDDKMNELDDMGNTIHYIDAEKTFYMKKASSATESGIILVDDPNDSVISTWDSTKVAYIAPQSSYKKTIESHKARLFGLGAATISVDQQSTTVTNSSTLETNYIAQRFTPLFVDCYNIAVYVGYAGTPNVNLTLFLVQDKAGKPEGSTVRTVDFALSQITAGGAWVYAPIGEKLTIGKNYWIIMSKGGADASNTYTWYRDAVDSGADTLATSTTGTSYTLTSSPNRFTYAFKEFENDQLIKIAPTGITTSTKHLHDEVLRRPDINDKLAMNSYINGLSATMLKRKEVFKCKVYSSDTILQPGQLVTVQKSLSGYAVSSQRMLVGDIEYIFDGSDDMATGTFYIDVEATKYTDYP